MIKLDFCPGCQQYLKNSGCYNFNCKLGFYQVLFKDNCNIYRCTFYTSDFLICLDFQDHMLELYIKNSISQPVIEISFDQDSFDFSETSIEKLNQKYLKLIIFS